MHFFPPNRNPCCKNLVLPFNKAIRRTSSHLEPQRGMQHPPDHAVAWPRLLCSSGRFHRELLVFYLDHTHPHGPQQE